MKRQSHEKQYWDAYYAISAMNRENMAWVNENLPLVEFPAICLHLADGETKAWVTNDTLLGLRFYDPGYARPFEQEGRMGEVSELSAPSIAALRDHMEQHFNSPASKRIQASLKSISDLMEGDAYAGQHPAVIAIAEIVGK